MQKVKGGWPEQHGGSLWVASALLSLWTGAGLKEFPGPAP